MKQKIYPMHIFVYILQSKYLRITLLTITIITIYLINWVLFIGKLPVLGIVYAGYITYYCIRGK